MSEKPIVIRRINDVLGIGVLGPKKIRRIARATGLEVAYARAWSSTIYEFITSDGRVGTFNLYTYRQWIKAGGDAHRIPAATGVWTAGVWQVGKTALEVVREEMALRREEFTRSRSVDPSLGPPELSVTHESGQFIAHRYGDGTIAVEGLDGTPEIWDDTTGGPWVKVTRPGVPVVVRSRDRVRSGGVVASYWGIVGMLQS